MGLEFDSRAAECLNRAQTGGMSGDMAGDETLNWRMARTSEDSGKEVTPRPPSAREHRYICISSGTLSDVYLLPHPRLGTLQWRPCVVALTTAPGPPPTHTHTHTHTRTHSHSPQPHLFCAAITSQRLPSLPPPTVVHQRRDQNTKNLERSPRDRSRRKEARALVKRKDLGLGG